MRGCALKYSVAHFLTDIIQNSIEESNLKFVFNHPNLDDFLTQIEIKNNFYLEANKLLISYINKNNLYTKESRIGLNLILSSQPFISDVFNIMVDIETHLDWLVKQVNDKISRGTSVLNNLQYSNKANSSKITNNKKKEY